MGTALQETVEWHCLEHQVLESKFEILELLQRVGGHAFFRVRAIGESQDMLLRAYDAEHPSAAVILDRFWEARFLDHPNLVQVLAVGRTQCAGRQVIYLLSEMAEFDLAEAVQEGHFDLRQISNLVRHLAAGLAYVHSENFVYCALRAGSIWRVGENWKLADFSEMRIAGRYPASETRKLLVTSHLDCPPEANDGHVSEGWDVWSLGSVLRKLLLQITKTTKIKDRPARTGASANISIAPPYDEILRESLEPDPALRANLDRILALLTEYARPATVGVSHVAGPEPLMSEPIGKAPEFRGGGLQGGGKKTAAIAAAIAVALAGSVLFGSHLFPSHAPVPTPKVVQPAMVKASPETNPETRPSPFGSDATATLPPGPGGAKHAISLVLNRWAAATRNRDLDALINCYAPLVDRFYGQRALSRERLRGQEQDVLARIGNVRKFEVSDIQFSRVGPQWAVVTFEKSWDFGNQSRFAGSERDEMIFRPVRGDWKIASQQELKRHWVNKQGSPKIRAPI